MIIKICGMGDPKIMKQLAELGPNMLGFIFHPKSARYVVDKIAPVDLEELPSSLVKVGIFVNLEESEVIQFCATYKLSTAQLHGSESPEYCSKIKAAGIKVIKALTLSDDVEEVKFEEYSNCCDYLLFDTPTPQHGGSGKKFNWQLLERYTGSLPFLLSGGIGPDDANELKQINHPKFAGIDINSKFEIKPGIKDFELIRNFIHQIKTQ